MATFIPGGVFGVSSITSHSMALRQERLKIAKQHADKTQRELGRDRIGLERKEAQLMKECKRLAQKGDMNGARLVANQITRFRRIHDRNLEASVQISTKSQSMVSQHKVNKAQVESIKGFSFANEFESFTRASARQQRNSYRMAAINHLEEESRESLHEAFNEGDEIDNDYYCPNSDGMSEDQMAEKRALLNEIEIDQILQQVMINEKQQPNRVYLTEERVAAVGDEVQKIVLHLKQYQPHCSGDAAFEGASIILSQDSMKTTSQSIAGSQSNLLKSISVDMVKRELIKDEYACSQLNLYQDSGRLKPFQLGRVSKSRNRDEWSALDFSKSLYELGIRSGDVVYVSVVQQDGNNAKTQQKGSSTTIETNGDASKESKAIEEQRELEDLERRLKLVMNK